MSLRHALLGLLDDEPASGYELMKVFNSSLMHVWPATQSQVYTELNRLADTGLISVSAEGARGRKDYESTRAGKAELRNWLRRPPQDVPHRSDLLLRVFFLDAVSRDDARRVLRTHREDAQAQHDRLSAIGEVIAADSDRLSVNGRIALEFGLRKAQMQIEWSQWALDEINLSAD